MTSLPRLAVAADLPELLRLEMESFATDRLSRRSLRRLLSSPSALCLVMEGEHGLAGYALWLMRRNSTMARLYSIAVDSRSQGRGLASRLLEEGERQVWQRGCRRMCLEVSVNNQGAIRVYHAMNYRKEAVRSNYYQDGADAWRMVKLLK